MCAELALNILLVDDDSTLREALRQGFARDGHRATGVWDGRAAIDRASTDTFDIVLLDVALGPVPTATTSAARCAPGATRCRSSWSPRAIPRPTPCSGLEAGADDYVTKPFGAAELRSRIRAVLRRAGPRALGDAVLKVGHVELDRTQRAVRAHGREVLLTFSEYEVLEALMSRPGELLSRQELMRSIRGDSAYRDPRGIDVHVRHLREKLEERADRPALLLTVRGAGYRLQTP